MQLRALRRRNSIFFRCMDMNLMINQISLCFVCQDISVYADRMKLRRLATLA